MDFKLSEETILIKNSAKEYLKGKCSGSSVREMIEDKSGFSKIIWKEMARLGWLGMLYDEEYGGLADGDSSFFDFFIILEEIGKVLLPSPLFCSAILSGLIMNEAGNDKQKNDYLPAIISGKTILTTAMLDEKGKYDYKNPNIKAVQSGDGNYTINGTRIMVPYAHIADEIIVCTDVRSDDKNGPTLFKISGKIEGQKLEPLDTLTGEKTFAVVYENTKVSSNDIIGTIGKGADFLHKILPKTIVLKCGEMLGGIEQVLDMTVKYVTERKQFGAPLGSLQVVQHYCADMATFLETTRLITYQAASLINEGIPCDKEIAMAKAWCSDAYKKCTWIGHQLHGGIGFTEEFDMHLFYKHAKESEFAFGDSFFHRSKVADEIGI